MLQKYLEEIEIYSDESDGEDSDEENPYKKNSGEENLKSFERAQPIS